MKKIPGEPAGNGVVAANGGGKASVDVAAAPFKWFGRGLQRLRPRHALGPEAEGPVCPDMHLAHVADRAAPQVLDGGPSIVGGVALVAHLRGDFGFLCTTRKFASFFDRPAERLLDVHMLAKLHGRQGNGGVHVVGRGDHDGVDILLALEHLAIVGVARGFLEVDRPESDHSVDARLRLDGIKGRR